MEDATTRSLDVAVVAESLLHRVPGGTGRAAASLITGLEARTDVDLVLVTAWHRRRDRRRVGPTTRQWWLPRALLYECWARFGGRPGSTRVAPDVDVVHSPMVPTPRRGTRPLVVTVHDLAFLQQPEASPRRARRLYERSWRRICAEADLVLCSSVATFNAATEHGLDPDRARVVPLGTTVPAVGRAVADATRDRFGLPETFVLSVGTAEPRKNLPGLLAAYAASGLAAQGVDLALVGPTGWREQLGDRIAELPDEVIGHVKPLGEVSEADLHGLYASASVFCYPSLLEGFGLPVLEAMAHGTPVITSSTTSTAEIVGDSGVLVDPTDNAALAEAMRALVGDHRRREELSRLGRVRAGDFTWDRHVARTVAAYREVLG